MVNFSQLDYNSLEDYNIDFEQTLLETNHTYDFFVNWEKVFSNLENSVVEISILNSLNKINSDNLEFKFREILKDYPNVVPILPAILAVREKKVAVFDMDKDIFKKVNFSKTSFVIDEILDFSKKTGLLNLFSHIDDLYSYLVGTEVGLDTNGRKNRSGHTFEHIVGRLLAEKIEDHPDYSLVAEETLMFERNKRLDFVIHYKDEPKFLFECNFYNSGGSKPIEVANAYVDLQKQIDDAGMIFIWVTDGLGWKKMSKALHGVEHGIDYILNYKMLSENIDKIIF